MKLLKDFAIFLLSEVPLLIIVFMLGFSARVVFPTAADKRMSEYAYYIACMDTRLNDIDVLAEKGKLKGCSILWKERNERREK